MSQLNWILGLVVLLLILFIAFAIFVIYYAYKIDAQLNVTINKLQDEFTAASNKIDNLNQQVTPLITEINTDISKFTTYIPGIEKIICGYVPTLPFCGK